MNIKFNKNYLSCCSGFIEDSKLYVIDRFFGTLMEFDIENYEYNVIAYFDFFDTRIQYRARKIIKVEDIFYFFFENSRKIYSWCFCSKSLETYGDEIKCDKRYVVVSDAFLMEKKIWIIPGWSDQPLRSFGTDTKKIQEYISIEQALGKFDIALEYSQTIDVSVSNDNIMWFIVSGEPYIIFYNAGLDEWGVYSLNMRDHISGICCDEKDIWIYFTDKSDFVIWNPQKGIMDMYRIPKVQLNMEEKDPFHFIYSYKKSIYVFPYFDNDIFIVDKETKEIFSMDFLSNYSRIEVRPGSPAPLFFGVVKKGKTLIILPYAIDVITVIDMESRSIRYVKCQKRQNEYNNYLSQVYRENFNTKGESFEGNNGFCQKDFLSFIKEYDRDEYKLEQQDIGGKLIFDKMKSSCL